MPRRCSGWWPSTSTRTRSPTRAALDRCPSGPSARPAKGSTQAQATLAGARGRAGRQPADPRLLTRAATTPGLAATLGTCPARPAHRPPPTARQRRAAQRAAVDRREQLVRRVRRHRAPGDLADHSGPDAFSARPEMADWFASTGREGQHHRPHGAAGRRTTSTPASRPGYGPTWRSPSRSSRPGISPSRPTGSSRPRTTTSPGSAPATAAPTAGASPTPRRGQRPAGAPGGLRLADTGADPAARADRRRRLLLDLDGPGRQVGVEPRLRDLHHDRLPARC